jgi:hypothetical protein
MRGWMFIGVLLLLPATSARAEDEGVAILTQAARTPDIDLGRFHLIGAGAYDIPSQQVAAEVDGTYSVSRYVDLGLGVSLGTSVGGVVLVDLHPSWEPAVRIRPFAQIRGVAHPSSGGYGGGFWVGARLECGPGRLEFGPAAEFFIPRAGYYPNAVMVMVGYEFDLALLTFEGSTGSHPVS